MKYESSILKRLIDTYGVIGNPRYLSEIIKEFIVRGKELYPQLFTYQSDWLAHIDEFGLTPEYTVSYTGQHIYAPNTKEKPVKSAILTGQTLVNEIDDNGVINCVSKKGITAEKIENGFKFTSSTSDGRLYTKPLHIKANTTYTYISHNQTSSEFISNEYLAFFTKGISFSEGSWTKIINLTNNTNSTTKYSFSFGQDMDLYIRFGLKGAGVIEYNGIMLVEGDYTNKDIPYFEGMQSVKMPVLTTSNEDGTKTNILTTPQDLVLRGIGDVKDELDLVSGELTQCIGEVVLDRESLPSHFPIEKDRASGYTVFCPQYEKLDIDIVLNNDVSQFVCDKLPNIWNGYNGKKDGKWISLNSVYLIISIPNEELDSFDREGFAKWLDTNPLLIQFKKSTPIIKTVDLTIHDKDHQKVERLTTFEGGTHFTTSSQDGSLLPTLTVDVVTDLEKTLMVCSLEGNTM